MNKDTNKRFKRSIKTNGRHFVEDLSLATGKTNDHITDYNSAIVFPSEQTLPSFDFTEVFGIKFDNSDAYC